MHGSALECRREADLEIRPHHHPLAHLRSGLDAPVLGQNEGDRRLHLIHEAERRAVARPVAGKWLGGDLASLLVLRDVDRVRTRAAAP